MATRVPKMQESDRDAILQWLRTGLPPDLACRLAGIDDSTLRSWRNYSLKGTRGYEGFDADVRQAMAQGEAANVARIQAAGKTNWRAAAWLLERTAPERWGPPASLPDGPPLGSASPVDDQAGL